MDSKSDSLLLSYKDNPELKAALGGLQPGETVELCVTVSVRANDDESFDALIDEVETMGSDEADEASEDDEESESYDKDSEDEDAPALVIVAKKNAK